MTNQELTIPSGLVVAAEQVRGIGEAIAGFLLFGVTP